MLKISFYNTTDSYGEFHYVERLHVGSPKWSEEGSDIKISSAALFVGTWISDFLSCKDEILQQYINLYDFTEDEKNDCIFAYRLFNNFLLFFPVNFKSFQEYMIKHHIQIPNFNYMLNKNREIEEQYECKDIAEFCTVLLHQALKLGYIFEICQNCYKWFIPNVKSDEKYCLRTSPQYKDKNCREAAKLIRTLNNRHTNEAIRLQKNIRQIFDNTHGNKFEFNQNNQRWKQNFQTGRITESQYIDWLKTNYKKKYKNP